jgi:hypothetical protein
VKQESGSEAETTYKTILAKIDLDSLDVAYAAIDNLIKKVDNYVSVSIHNL